jgi:hypothetical protein
MHHPLDAPYLTPVPYRGKPNSPAYTYYTAEKLADIRGQTIETIADATTNNFRTLCASVSTKILSSGTFLATSRKSPALLKVIMPENEI